MKRFYSLLIGALMLAGNASAQTAEIPTTTTPAGVELQAVAVRSGYYQAENCVPETDPKLSNECICKADIQKAQVKGLPPRIATIINNQLAQVPEQLGGESCTGKAVAATEPGGSVNEVTAKYELVYQSPSILSVLVSYSTYGASAVHHIPGSEGYTIDLATGRTINPTEKLKPEQLAKANEFLKQELLKKHGDALFDEAKTQLGTYLTDSGCETCTLYYTAEGWNVRFQVYSVAPYAAGEPTVVIPTHILPDPATLVANR